MTIQKTLATAQTRMMPMHRITVMVDVTAMQGLGETAMHALGMMMAVTVARLIKLIS